MTPPVALSIAGSDPSGGAGIQADLKTFSALGVYGCAAMTALTAQSTMGVTGIHVVPANFVVEQVRTLAADVHIDAVKIGMLATAEICDTVGELIGDVLRCPVVLDPVMISTAGSRLLDADAMAAMSRLVGKADAITPNLHEAAALLGTEPAGTVAEMRTQATALIDRGVRRVLLKGGHLAAVPGGAAAADDRAARAGSDTAAPDPETAAAVDVWADEHGVTELTAPVVPTRNTHGTGCSLSSAIAALLPQRASWLEAVTGAKNWLTDALGGADSLHIGAGPGPVHHFHRWWVS